MTVITAEDDMFKSCPCGRGEPDICSLHSVVKQVLVIRRDLKMRRGKEIAQGAHASMAWLTSRMKPSTGEWYDVQLTAAERAWVAGNFRKITCQVPDEESLLHVMNSARSNGVIAHLITDAGLTEFAGVPTITACAIGPDYDGKVNQVTGHLQLY